VNATLRAHRASSDVAVAVSLAILVTAVEYFFRHYVLFWMPKLGTLRANDLVVLALAYSSLALVVGAIARLDGREALRGVGRALREFLTQWTYTAWFIGLIACLVVLPFADRWLWSGFRVPLWISSYRNPTVWFAPAAAVLTAVAAIAINGILVPIVEEYLWRGQIQIRLLRVIPAAAAIAVTAVLFSLKHVLVDASWSRFLTLVAFGVICGIVALRGDWRNSAAMHVCVNTVTTAAGLVQGVD
jgi:membrane protease YdiL (CAAX protease family)